MSPALRITIFFIFTGAGLVATFGGAVYYAYDNSTDETIQAQILLWGGGALLLGSGLMLMLFSAIMNSVLRPLQHLTRDLETALHTPRCDGLQTPDEHSLGRLPGAVNELLCSLEQAQNDVTEAINKAKADTEYQKRQLETILLDLTEGVIVCNMHHKVVLYNNASLQLLHAAGELGLGRSLFSVVSREPIEHTIERIMNRIKDVREHNHPEGLSAGFVAASADDQILLNARMALIIEEDNEIGGYVITFSDITEDLNALGRRDSLIRSAIEGLRAPLGNLGAAVETIAASDEEMDVSDRRLFDGVIQQESQLLGDHLSKMALEYKELITGHWPMADFYLDNLISSLTRRLSEHHGITLAKTGSSVWAHGDTFSLLLMIEELCRHLSSAVDQSTIELSCEHRDRRAYIDLAWTGNPISSGELDVWVEAKLTEALGGMSVKDVLVHHGAEIWSDCVPRSNPKKARLRIPLPPPTRLYSLETPEVLPPRPEFYDFDLNVTAEASADARLDTPLRELEFVVFDTETTGLEPSNGDEIIQIAGVRVLNARILSGECFERLVNPGFEIPPASIRFHHITDDMVQDQANITDVLPQFHRFVGDAILVAHNAAFDMRFLKMKEPHLGLAFDQPVLDTLLLSVFLHDHTPEHSLEAVAERLGLDITGRHTALGDSQVTAEIWLRFIELLENRDIRTLRDAMDVESSMVEVRKRQAAF